MTTVTRIVPLEKHRILPGGKMKCEYCGQYVQSTTADWGRTHECPVLDIEALQPPQAGEVTAGITHFKRPASLQRLLVSMQEHAPHLAWLKQDTNGNLSHGRNTLIECCQTPYFLLLEDDFEFTSRTSVDKLKSILEHDHQIGGVGGKLVYPEDLGRETHWAHDFKVFRGEISLVRTNNKWRCTPEGVPYLPCEAILNFGLFRTDFLREVRWCEQLPVMEHHEFYWRASKQRKYLMAYCPEVEIKHHADRPSETYRQFRFRDEYIQQMSAVMGLKYVGMEVEKREQRPNIVVLTAGHTGSRLIVRIANFLGWNYLPTERKIDREFSEIPDFNHMNIAILNGTPPRREEMDKFIEELPQPWVLKDPRLRLTWRTWLPSLMKYEPLCILSTRCPKAMKRSYDRIKDRYEDETLTLPQIEQRIMQAMEAYHNWPWPKLIIDHNSLLRMAEFIDVPRMKL